MDAMVTARMPKGKKKAALEAIGHTGLSTSQIINMLFDYVIEHGRLPFEQGKNENKFSNEALAEAREWADSIKTSVAPEFITMTDDEIRQARLRSKGLM